MIVANLIFIVVLLFGFSNSGYAVTPDEILEDPILEERARNLSAKLRCLVCQNQSIDDSDAPLAKDLRILVRQKLVEGSNDIQVLDFVVSKYGEFVLLQPRFTTHTYMLWILPPIIFLIGLVAIVFLFKNQRKNVPATVETKLSAEDKKRLQQVLKNDSTET